MPRLATQADFEGLVPDALYGNYHKYPFFAERATWVENLHSRLVAAGVLNTVKINTKILVAGAAFGYLVEELLARGFDVLGFDLSDYAIQKMETSVNATARGRMQKRDMLNGGDYTALRQSHDLRGNQKWHIIISEDVLPCLSDTEAEQGVSLARNGGTVRVHMITPGQPTDLFRVPTLNWKTMAQWRTFLTPTNGVMPDWLLSLEGDVSTNPSLEYPPDGWVNP